MSLLARLFLLVLIASLPAVGIQAYTVFELRDAREHDLRNAAERLLRLIDAEQARILEGVRQVLITVGETNAVYKGDAAACQDFLDRLDQSLPAYQEVYITDVAGRVQCGTNRSAVGLTVAGQSHFEKAMAAGTFEIGEHVLREQDGDPVLPLALPYDDRDGRRAGIVAMLVNLGWLESYLAQKPLPPNATLTVADRNGIVLTRLPENRTMTIGRQLPPEYLDLLNTGSVGVVERVGLDGVTRVMAYSPANDNIQGLFVSIGLDKRAALQAIDRAASGGIVMIFGGLLAALACAWLGGHLFIRRPVAALVMAAERWRAGDWRVRARLGDGNSEIGRLGRAFDAMAEALLEREDAIRDRERMEAEVNATARRMAAVLECTTDGVFEVDRHWRLVFINERARSMLAGAGDLEEADFWSVFPGLTGTLFEREFRRAMTEQRPVELEDTYAPRQAWYAIRIFPSRDGLAVYVQDITARRRAEEESRAQRAKYQAIVDTAVDPIAVIDHQGFVQSFNRAAEAIFGYSAAEVIGRNVSMLMPEPYSSAHDAYIKAYERTGERKIIGIGREVQGRRKDGTVFPLHLSIAEWAAGGRRYFSGIMRDITEQKRYEKALRDAKDSAERANLSKSKFLAAASHDLRQPVQSLFFFAAALTEQLRHHPSLPMMDTMQQALNALKMLLDGLLDISRLDAGIVTPELTAFTMDGLLRRLSDEYAPRAALQGLELRLVACRAWVRSDPVLLERLLRNLIENALRYTRRGGIVLGCRRQGTLLRVDVCDTGIGIPEGRLEDIFDEFTQVGNQERDREQGLGLGLAIVRRLSRLLGHPVRVRSELGRGSTFSVEVPMAEAPRRTLPAPANDEHGLSGAGGDAGARLVLVIDDEAIVLMGLQAMLESWGHEVMAATSQQQALALIRARGRRPDLILADYRLREGRTGLEALRAIHQTYGSDIPSIVLTGDTAPERMQEAQSSGFSILHKPVSARHLRSVITMAAPA